MTQPPNIPPYGTPEYAEWYERNVGPTVAAGAPPIPPQQQPKKKRHILRWTGGVGAGIVAVIVIAAVASGGSKKPEATAPAASTQVVAKPAATNPPTHAAKKATHVAPRTTHAPAPTHTTVAPKPRPKPQPKPAPKPVPKTVVFTVSGTGKPDITYGSDSDNRSGNTHTSTYGQDYGDVPFTATLPLDDDTLYYVVTAQLQGSGDITCKLVINGKTVATGHASGGYNICSAQAGQGVFGGWEQE